MAQQPHLPPFRVRQLLPEPAPHPATPAAPQPNVAGVVSMRRRSYDRLLARKPDAALSYVDDDDGEHVTVGSSFELLQRLQEPFAPAIEQWNQSLNGSTVSVHAFDVKSTQDVKSVWQPYLIKAMPDPVSDGSGRQHPRDTKPSSLPSRRQTDPQSKASESTKRRHNGSLTLAGERQVKEAAATLRRASKAAQYLANADLLECSPHMTRWASYGSLPASFTPAHPAATTTSQEDGAVRASTSTEAKSSDQSLLALFEAELSRLTSGRPSEQSVPLSSAETQSPTGVVKGTTTSTAAQTQPNYQSSQTQTAANNPPRGTAGKPMEALFDRIERLASSTSNISQELRRLAASAPGEIDDLMAFVRSRVPLLGGDQSAVTSQPESTTASRMPNAVSHTAAPQTFAGTIPRWCTVDSGAKTAQLAVYFPNAPGGRDPYCGNKCLQLTGCVRANCPVREAVKDVHNDIFGTWDKLMPQETPRGMLQHFRSMPQHFQVDRLVARRYISYDSMLGPRKKQYLVRWVGHGPEEDVWYDVESLVHCKELVIQYDLDNAEPDSSASMSPIAPQTSGQKERIIELHSRAADRMITFEPPTGRHNVEAVHRPFARQTGEAGESAPHPQPLFDTPAGTIPQDVHMAAPPRGKPKPAWTDKASTANARKELRHRKSWHSTPRATKREQDTNSFDFSPLAVMKKYPPVAFINAENTTDHASAMPVPLGPDTAFQSLPKEKSSKAVTFSEYETTIDQANQHAGPARDWPCEQSAYSSAHQVDPSLYAPPSPAILPLKRQSTMVDLQTPASKYETTEPSVRRTKSLGFRSMRPPSSGKRPRDQSEGYQADPGSRLQAAEQSEHTSQTDTPRGAHAYDTDPIALPRRANTTATLRSAARRDEPAKYYQRSPRNEADTRRDNVTHCTFRLAEMGFPRKEAAVVSETVSGDLESALDILNEDGRARDEFERRGGVGTKGWGATTRMPGAFTSDM